MWKRWNGTWVGMALVLGLFVQWTDRGLISSQASEKLQSPRNAPSFNWDVRPILSNRCFKCHGPDLQKGDLDLHNRDKALRGGKSGQPAIVPGKSDASELIRRVISSDKSYRMPRGADPLPEHEIAILRAWIDAGAVYEEHWAFVPPRRPPLPPVRNPDWVRNPIDQLVLARMEQVGLSPSPPADKAVLARRVALDLTGLPPTLEELDAFLSDHRPDAYERYVERLLASPHYGEHQARYWLDLARYADTNGYEADYRRSIWPYRDWVIDAFNRNLPFDQFTLEQLAGDLLPNATLQQRIATGFHRNTLVNTEGGTDDEEFRVAAVVDRVNTTMTVWMGLTFGCAQCHNHKYDPFTTREYYQMFAFFNNTADGGRSNDPQLTFWPEPVAREREAILGRLLPQLAQLAHPWPLVAAARLKPVLRATEADRKKLASLQPAVTLVMQELPQPRETHILIRGELRNRGEKVEPATPAKLHPFPADAPRNRLGLARWLVDRRNPLTARVIMNRVWGQYWGRPLVETSSDFGYQGDPPIYQELLDWLAVEFMDSGWNLKHMHKLIVTSNTYRQSSRLTPFLKERDPENRYFARGPRFRMDAEMLRDNALAISGLLVRKIGGPSVFPYQPEGIWFNPYSSDRWVMSTGGDQYRRGLYTFWRRTAHYPSFAMFDAPSREVCCDKRPRTNTPLQALVTLNDPAFFHAAIALGLRLTTECSGTPQERATYGFRLCVARQPSPEEIQPLVALYHASREKYQRQPEAARKLVEGPEIKTTPPADVVEWAAWTVVANVLLNLDETLCKP
ncbi:MAG: PSD1 and planctomycete cytochrome C domain-containing protein [Gemmatales bacterium]|nr:PSD1 and planctomycete cytochrome C domain-containing protein [Gemmatales bacterium]MDW7995919.1 PSD1 and planctomycete cytochrome C domain-containing protein [Gemmatales bacterium]